MDTLDKFLNLYAYRFDKGYPDMNNEKDVQLLNKILYEELNLKKDMESNILEEVLLQERSSAYDDLIKSKLKVDNLPVPGDNYELGVNTKVGAGDLVIFSQLYPLTPSKKGGIENVGSQNSGYGEVAMYWLLSKKYPNIMDSRKGGDPDLSIGEIGLEVKSYDTKRMSLGRFSSDKDNMTILNTLFGLYSLISTLEHKEGETKKANPLTFTSTDLIKAFDVLNEFSSNEDLRNTDFPVINNMFANVDNLLIALGIKEHNFSPKSASAQLLKRILSQKCSTKPRFGGYIVNINDNGNIEYHKITKEIIDEIPVENINKYVSANQGQLIINPDNLF
jgi:hypothetical protein